MPIDNFSDDLPRRGSGPEPGAGGVDGLARLVVDIGPAAALLGADQRYR